MEFLQKNIAALAAANPELAAAVEAAPVPENLEVIKARSGAPVPRLAGALLHSGYDPEKEAAGFGSGAEAGPGSEAIVFGFAFGYHLERIAQSGARVTVIEPSTGMLRATFMARDLSGLLESITLTTPEGFSRTAPGLDYTRAAWLDHGPTARMFQRERDSLAEPFAARTIAARGGYKIMVVGPTYGGTTTTAASAARALEGLGFAVDFVDNTSHQAEYFGIDSITPNPGHRAALKSAFSGYLGETVAARADYARPDMILALAQAPLSPETIKRLKGLGAPVAFWFVEDYRTLKYWSAVAPHYDYFFCIQKGRFLDALQKAGAPYAAYLPQAADEWTHRPLTLSAEDMAKYGADISFMGAGYPNRQKFFAGLLDTPLKIWGTEWNLATPLGARVVNANRRLAPEEYVKIFSASRINLNLHSSLTYPGVDPVGDFLNPRVFEIAACGGFQLVDEREYLPEMYEVGQEIVTYRSLDDLRGKIDHYLKSPEERSAIAEAGMRRTLAEHTFTHRMARLVNTVFAREADRIERARQARRSANDVDAMMERAGDHPELAAFLGRFRGQGRLSLAKVMEAIERGEGPLTRPEAIFVMIDQILTQGRS